MSQKGTQNADEREVDIRGIAPHDAERRALQAYGELGVGDALILLDDHNPQTLHDTFEREFAGSFSWETLSTNDGEYRICVTKRATTALPRVVADTTERTTKSAGDARGSVWQLEPGARELDSNSLVLPPHEEFGQAVGPALVALVLVLQGS